VITADWEAHAGLVVAGTGVAGLTAGLHAHRLGLDVMLIAKGDLEDGNTRLAQGGIAVVLPGDPGPEDSVRRHAEDTLSAGAGLCEPGATASILAGGATALGRMRARGAVFDVADGGLLAKAMEGGHTVRRILRAGGDATGAEVERALVHATREAGLTCLENHVITDVLLAAGGAVAGVAVLGPDGRRGFVRAASVLLATGGIGQLYHMTSNSEVATGDGVALALRAGAAVADMEFVQFHPTVLYTGRAAHGRCPLVTEALRGEGAVLVDATGGRVMTGVHPLADLAPRDVVSAAITRHMALRPGGVDDHVFLDSTHLTADVFRRRFPTVHAACQAIGVDPAGEPIPVAPAAHYHCGGILTDHLGRTSVPGLYAAGESARTGLHGANRLASNSLLEGLVLGERVAATVAASHAAPGEPQTRPAVDLPAAEPGELRRLMSARLAIGRDADGLRAASEWIARSAAPKPVTCRADYEAASLTLVARAIAAAAEQRRESRGCHVRTDYPHRDDQRWRRSLVQRLDPSGALVPGPATALGNVA